MRAWGARVRSWVHRCVRACVRAYTGAVIFGLDVCGGLQEALEEDGWHIEAGHAESLDGGQRSPSVDSIFLTNISVHADGGHRGAVPI